MSSGFITETEANAVRKRRQEEWERVRKADDPIERPEEPYDPRSLYERLQEQKQKKDLEYEEARKLKNMIKGLDDDEIDFLELVDRTKLEADRKKELEEELELNDYRNRVAVLQEKSIDERLQVDIVVNKPKSITSTCNSQQKLLKGIVLKRNESGKKRKLSDTSEVDNMSDNTANKQIKEKGDASNGVVVLQNSGLKCVGILPGLGPYEDSSSDENSSDSEINSKPTVQLDLLGRKMLKKETNN